MKNTHLETYISIPKIYNALDSLRRLGNKHYQSAEFDRSFIERWKNEDPEGYDMVFGEDEDHGDGENDDGKNEESSDDEEDNKESTEYAKEDAVQKWKFNFDNVTTFVNDYPELEVKENIKPNNKNCLNEPIIIFISDKWLI